MHTAKSSGSLENRAFEPIVYSVDNVDKIEWEGVEARNYG